MISAALWTISDGMDLIATSLGQHMFWAKLSYLGAGTISVFLLHMAIEYTGRYKMLGARVTAALLAVPILGFAVTSFNEYHHLSWTGVIQSSTNPRVLTYEHGPLFWFLLAYAFALLMATSAVLVHHARSAPREHRRQSLTLIAGIVIPWAAMVVYVVAPGQFPGFNPSIALALSGLIFISALLRRRLLSLVPIARDTLMETMSDGLVVTDILGNGVVLNPAGARLLGLDAGDQRPRQLGELLGHWPELVERIKHVEDTDSHFTLKRGALHIGFELLPLKDKFGVRQGGLLLARDVTAQVETEGALTRTNEELHTRLADIEELHTELREQAIRDPLTGLVNRRYLNEVLEGELGRAARERYPVSFIMVDIDGFKHINDLLGHATGDLILRVLGSQLLAQIRPGDIACRYGGDEFLVVLTNTDLHDAGRRAQQWRTGFEESSAEIMGLDEPVSISIGVATYPTHGVSAQQVFAAADAALYSAKAAGRNRVIVSSV
jgi:diguanylate cyclase (GGDEF)-like protein